uniref:Uncharacterized protein n=1 Tax=Oryza punctata TaxID=4537 RepID=A0A0E0KXF5_ORYPU
MRAPPLINVGGLSSQQTRGEYSTEKLFLFLFPVRIAVAVLCRRRWKKKKKQEQVSATHSERGMEHYSTRFTNGGGRLVDPIPDRRSRFWQMDSQPTELICPMPRRPSPRPPFLSDSINRTLPVYRADPASDVLDLILNKNDPDVDTDSSSQVGFFCGSPPVRANNPIVHDPQFGKNIPSFSPLGSSFGKKCAGRAEVGSPSCGASSPKVRIEGFACGNKEPHCAVTFA